MVQACQGNVIDYLVHGIDWNGLMPANVFLKCLIFTSYMYEQYVNNINEDRVKIIRKES